MAATNLIPSLVAAPSATTTNGLRDIKPPIEIPSLWPWVWWGLGLLILAGLGFFAWRWWQRKRKAAEVVLIIPVHIRAKRKLHEALAWLADPREFCIRVSDTVRWYLEERFDFHAPERTTEEFLHELHGTDLLTADQKHTLGHFLQRCDLVKFARYEPGEPELRELHAAAVRLVEETEPVLAPADAAVAPAAGSTVQTACQPSNFPGR